MKYDAFISYSHAADGKLAPFVQRALHRFAKPWYRMRQLHVYRDATSLSATPELWGSIEDALSQSRHFLLFASPEAAASKWVQREIEWWCANRDTAKIFILATDGQIAWDHETGDFDWDRTNALPRQLEGIFVAEPLWIDLTFILGEDELSLHNPQFYQAILNLAAPLHGLPKDELGGADVRQHQRTRRIAAAAVTALVILLIASLTAAWIATVQRDNARSRELAALSRIRLETDPAESLALAAEAMQTRPTTEARQMLRTAIFRSHLRAVTKDHSGRITTLEVSPDGKRILSADTSGTTLVWDPNDPASGQRLEGYRAAVHWPSDTAVSVLSGGALAVWDLKTGVQRRKMDTHSATVSAIAISPDGKIAASGGRGKNVILHDLATGERNVQPINARGIVTDLVFSPDGRFLAIGSIYNTILLVDPGTGRILREAKGISMSFSPEGDLLLTGGADGSGGSLIPLDPIGRSQPVEGMTGSIKEVIFSPDGQHFAAASSDGTARIWHRSGRLRHVVSGHENWVDNVAFSLDGRFLVTASRDYTARVWSVVSGNEAAVLRGHTDNVSLARFLIGARRIVTGAEDGTVRLWEIDMGLPATVVPGPIRAVQQLAFTPQDRYLIATSDTGAMDIWDRQVEKSAKDQNGTYFGLTDSGVVVAGPNHIIRLLDYDGSLIRELGRHKDHVSGIVVSPDRRLVVSTGEDNTALLFNLEGGQAPLRLAHADGVSAAAFSPDGSLLVTTTFNGEGTIWQMPSGDKLTAFKHSDKIISGVTFTGDGDKIVTASWNGTLALWEAKSGTRIRTFDSGSDRVYAFSFLKDGSRIVAGGNDGALEVWNLDNGTREGRFVGHSDSIYQIAVHPIHDLILSTSNDGTARLWDAGTGEEIATYAVHGNAIWAAAFSHDGRHFATGAEDGDVHIYKCFICVADEDLLAIAKEQANR